jgi:hypothetical protein
MLLLLLLLPLCVTAALLFLQGAAPVWQLVQQLQRGDARHEASILYTAAARHE